MFESLTVIIVTSNETDSLRKTLNDVLQCEAYDDISQIILFLKSATCPSAAVAKQLQEECNCDKIEIQIQKTGAYNFAFKEIPHLVKSSHFVIMVSDGEMDARTLKEFVRIAKQKPESIVCGSKWHKDSVVENAHPIRAIGSKIINKMASVAFGVKASDIFSIFQIYPIELYKKLNTSLFEYTLIPLRLGVEYIEIPTHYKREEGRQSTFHFKRLLNLTLGYIQGIIRVRFTPKDRL